MQVVRRADRSKSIKLRGGMAGSISNRDGKMEGVTRQERMCKECDSGEV